jgi:protein-tyrosine-phosphatase
MGKLHAVAHILVVCTGNICRSPMAEGFLREELADRGIQSITVSSCGVAAWDGGQATVEAVEAMHERGIDIGGHAARRLAHWMLEETDLVLTMAVEHREAVDRMDPEVADRAFTIKELVAILDALPHPLPGDPAAQLEHGVRAAATLRAEGRAPEILDEDVADPLGLSLPAYQAAAWELGELSRRLSAHLFDAVDGAGGNPGQRMASQPSGNGGPRADDPWGVWSTERRGAPGA